LDAAQPENARIEALGSVETIFDAQQVVAFIQVARDPSESAIVRATALGKLGPHLHEQMELVTAMAAWVQDPKTPQLLRRASLLQLRQHWFTLSVGPAREALLGTMRGLLRDPDIEVRRVGFGVLAAEGDDITQRLILEGLNDPQKALLQAPEAVPLLGLHLRADFYPTLYRLVLDPPDPVTRLESIRLVGGYPPAHDTLGTYVRDRRQPEDVRMAAAATLHANDPEGFGDRILPVVEDETATDRLRVYGIRAEMLRRESRSFRASRKGPDRFDAAMDRLARQSRSSAVRQAAAQYVARLVRG
jgi:hypothetical protein